MAGTLKFELVTPERMVMSGDAEQVVVPGIEGEFTVLPGHAPVVSSLRPGVIEVALADAKKLQAYVRSGFAEVEPDRVTVLAQRALDLASVETADITAELQRAETELAEATDDTSRLTASFAVERLKVLQR